jgi:cytochrome P450
MNYNDTVFPSPKVFTPDRWMSDDVEAVRLMNATTAPFSKGSRGCIGKNLALAELYLTIAITIRRFKVAQIIDEDLKIREIFGVIFDKPVRMRLEVVTV